VKDCSAHSRALQRSGPPATDFTWSDKGEIHAIRRREILAQHPEIKELYAPDIWSAVFAALTIALQLYMAWFVKNWTLLQALPLTYVISGTLNHSLHLAAHELSHDLFFKSKWMNKWFSYFCNVPHTLAAAATFRRYHLEHHSGQGVVDIDMDVPTFAEGRIFTSKLGRLLFLTLQPFFYGLRPLIVKPKAPSMIEVENWVVVIISNIFVATQWGSTAYFYLLGGTLLGMSLHPLSGHFVAEHFEFVKGQETYSYYGPLNYLTYNVGYHNEHHDFPKVPGRLLPRVKALAPEWYAMPSYSSWPRVMCDFVMNDNISLYSRIKRKSAFS